MIDTTFVIGVKVFLNSSPTTAYKTDIGLFSDVENGSNDVFRWSSADLTIFAPTYSFKTGILNKKNIGSIVERLPDPFNGGDIAGVNSSDFTLNNSIYINGVITPFDRFLYRNNIHLLNCVCEILFFQIDNGILVNPDGLMLMRGSVGTSTSNETTITYSVTDSYKLRSVNISSIDNDNSGDKINPCLGVFKELKDVSGNTIHAGLAPIIRTVDKEVIFKCGYDVKMADSLYMSVISTKDVGLYIFPVVNTGTDPVLQLDCNILLTSQFAQWKDAPGASGNEISIPGEYEITELKGYTVSVVAGEGKGQVNTIEQALLVLEAGNMYTAEIILKFEQIFKTPLKGIANGEDPDNSWVTLIKSENNYALDVWPCKSFLDSEGVETLGKVNISNYVNETNSFTTIPSEGVIADSDNKNIILPPELYFKNKSDFSNWGVIFPESIRLAVFNSAENFKELALYYGKSIWQSADTSSPVPGFYALKYDESFGMKLENVFGDVNSIINTSRFDGLSFRWRHLNASSVVLGNGLTVFEVFLPKLDTSIDFNNVYMGISVTALGSDTTTSQNSLNLKTKVVARRQVGLNQYEKSIILPIRTFSSNPSLRKATIYNIPDSFYTDILLSPYQRNKLFAYDNINWIYEKDGLEGYTASGVGLYDMTSLSGRENFNSFDRFYVFVELDYFENIYYVDVNVDSITLFYERNVKPDSTLFSSVKGRVFNDTWGGRKIASEDIKTPMEFIEHFKRIGNWMEVGDTNEFGKEYAPNAKIDTDSFDSVELGFLNSFTPFLKKEGTIDELIRIITHNYWINSYVDTVTGNEKLSPVARRAIVSPTTYIDYGDILGEIGVSRDLGTDKLYPQFTIRYAYNYAKNGYDRSISITNTNKGVFDSTYIIGVTGYDAELLWSFGHKLFEVCKYVENPNNRMIELESVYNYEEAIFYIKKLYEMMGVITTDGTTSGIVYDPKRILEFSTSLHVGLHLHRGDHIYLKLPHQTENVNVEVEILEIEKNINDCTVKYTVLFLGYEEAIDTDIQEVINNGLQPDWDETVQAKIIHGEGEDVDENS